MVRLSYSEKSILIIFVMITMLVSMIYLALAQENVYASGVTPKIKIGASNSTKTVPKTNITNTTTANNSSNNSTNNSTTNPNTIQDNTNSQTNSTTEQNSSQITNTTISSTGTNTKNSSNNIIKINFQKNLSQNSTEKQIQASSQPGITGAAISTEKNFDWNIILMFFSFILTVLVVSLLMYNYRKNKSDDVKRFSA
jgi:hypothetical protein